MGSSRLTVEEIERANPPRLYDGPRKPSEIAKLEALREWRQRSARKAEAKRREKPVRRIGRNRKRQAERWKAAFGSTERRARIAAEPCVVPGCTNRPCENHHYPTRGAGGTWRDVSPLCLVHHREFHDAGPDTWQDRYGVNLANTNREYARRFPVDTQLEG